MASIGSCFGKGVGRRPLDSRVEVGQERVYPIAFGGIKGALDNLHVLLRHRLLRQPGGFEGFGGIQVGSDANRFAVLKVAYDAVRRLRLCAAALAASVQATGRENPVAEVADFWNATLLSSKASSRSRHRSRTPSCPRYTVAFPPSIIGTASYHSTAASSSSSIASKSRRSNASTAGLKVSTFSCDIAYSDSPAASRVSGSRGRSGTRSRLLAAVKPADRSELRPVTARCSLLPRTGGGRLRLICRRVTDIRDRVGLAKASYRSEQLGTPSCPGRSVRPPTSAKHVVPLDVGVSSSISASMSRRLIALDPGARSSRSPATSPYSDSPAASRAQRDRRSTRSW